MFGKKNDQDYDMQLFTVYDSKSKTYSEPFFAPNRDVLLRDFATAFGRPDAPEKNKYFINAEDYSVFRIGGFDPRTAKGEMTPPEHIVNLHDVRAMSKQDAGPRALLPT